MIKKIITIITIILILFSFNYFIINQNKNIENYNNEYIESIEKHNLDVMKNNYEFLMSELDKLKWEENDKINNIEEKLAELKIISNKSSNMTLEDREKSKQFITKYQSIKKELEIKKQSIKE